MPVCICLSVNAISVSKFPRPDKFSSSAVRLRLFWQQIFQGRRCGGCFVGFFAAGQQRRSQNQRNESCEFHAARMRKDGAIFNQMLNGNAVFRPVASAETGEGFPEASTLRLVALTGHERARERHLPGRERARVCFRERCPGISGLSGPIGAADRVWREKWCYLRRILFPSIRNCNRWYR